MARSELARCQVRYSAKGQWRSNIRLPVGALPARESSTGDPRAALRSLTPDRIRKTNNGLSGATSRPLGACVMAGCAGLLGGIHVLTNCGRVR